jgi:rare lipoprotein A
MRLRGRGGRFARGAAIAFACLALANCSSSDKLSSKPSSESKYGVSASPRVVEMGDPVPKGGGVYRVGKPYLVGGRMYVPEANGNYRAEGAASWYGSDFHGRRTANGEVYDMASVSAAHPTLPMPSYVRVTNLVNKRSIIVRVNDRGPYHADRVIDVSARTAQLLDFHRHGVTRVRVEYVGRAPLEGSDDRLLVATLREHGPAPAPSRVMLASSRSFLPSAARVDPAWATPPIPQERPFDLGRESPPARAALPGRPQTAAPRPAVANLDTPQLRLRSLEPVSAYAPMDGVGERAFTSGRGLY